MGARPKQAIANKKAATEKGTSTEAKARLQSLRRAKHGMSRRQLQVQEYNGVSERKKELEREKASAKKALTGMSKG